MPETRRMPSFHPGISALLIFAMAVLVSAQRADSAESASTGIDFYESEIRPILVRRCYECHSTEAGEPESELLLDTRSGWLAGGARGAAVIPGQPLESLLLQAVRYDNVELQMPPDSRLPKREIQLLTRWIEMGALGSNDGASKIAPRRSSFDLAGRKSEHWAWRPPLRPSIPLVSKPAWPRDELDNFILAKLDAAELGPAAEVPPPIWLRRVTFALHGLPPARPQIERFVADPSESAYEHTVDQLLAAPEFGEHWAQHWLDLMRFAETKGHEQDFTLPEAWRYRDYVIRAFNSDVPYDEFVLEHIAGDLMPHPRIDPETRTNQSIQGTGFWHFGEATHSPVDIRGEEADRVANQIDVFSRSFLGLTLACARCHDHKFDALTTADYYALCGFLQSSGYQLADVSDPDAQQRAYESLDSLNREFAPRLAKKYAIVCKNRLDRLPELLLEAAFQSAERGTAESDVASPAEKQKPSRSANGFVELLQTASSTPEHLFYPFAVIAGAVAGDNGTAGADVQNSVRKLLHRMRHLVEDSRESLARKQVNVTTEDGELNYVTTPRSYNPAIDLVADYSACGKSDWITSGLRMGKGPVKPGAMLLANNKDHPLERIVAEPSACGDLVSRKFTGFLRTKTFEVVGDTLWYRYRGKAEAFLAVDSHRTVAGPLHGAVRQELDSDDEIRWFGHKVQDYLGHRVHVEFTPSGPFELYEVRFGSAEPPVEIRLNLLLCEALASNRIKTLADVANTYRSVFSNSIHAFENSFTDEDLVRDQAELVNWLLENDELLPPSTASEAAELQKFSRDYVSKRLAIEEAIPEPIFALALLDGSGENEHIHIRGNHRQLAEASTPRRFLEAIDGDHEMPISSGSGRWKLAQRLVDADNPFTARVFVNRVWHHLFGRGLVPTVDDFGVMGEPPTHPELLDYLAVEFVESGWDVKGLIKRMVLSATFRVSSQAESIAESTDPANALFHRANLRRLTGEEIRDAILFVSGQLNRKQFGPSVPIYISNFMRHNRSPQDSGPMDGDGRRSIYLEVRRNQLSHFLTAYDKPAPFTTIGRRNISNSGAQPLILLNDPFVHDQAKKWANQLLTVHGSDGAAIVEEAFLACFGRQPSLEEKRLFLAFVEEQAESGSDAERLQAWQDVCHTLFNAKEFIFVN